MLRSGVKIIQRVLAGMCLIRTTAHAFKEGIFLVKWKLRLLRLWSLMNCRENRLIRNHGESILTLFLLFQTLKTFGSCSQLWRTPFSSSTWRNTTWCEQWFSVSSAHQHLQYYFSVPPRSSHQLVTSSEIIRWQTRTIDSEPAITVDTR